MDLLKDENELSLHDDEWKIYSANPVRPAQYIGPEAKIKNSLIVEGCIVNGIVENSVLFQGVHVGENTVIRNSVIMPNTIIEENSVIDKAIIGSEVHILSNCNVGNGDSISVIASNENIEEVIK